MKKYIIILALMLKANVYGQLPETTIYGTYYSKGNKFERWSIMTINSDSTFLYEYGVGGCQADISGTWARVNNFLVFKNDFEYTDEYFKSLDSTSAMNDTLVILMPKAFYPDLGRIWWKIKKRSIKPMKPIDTGCLIEKNNHKKN